MLLLLCQGLSQAVAALPPGGPVEPATAQTYTARSAEFFDKLRLLLLVTPDPGREFDHRTSEGRKWLWVPPFQPTAPRPHSPSGTSPFQWSLSRGEAISLDLKSYCVFYGGSNLAKLGISYDSQHAEVRVEANGCDPALVGRLMSRLNEPIESVTMTATYAAVPSAVLGQVESQIRPAFRPVGRPDQWGSFGVLSNKGLELLSILLQRGGVPTSELPPLTAKLGILIRADTNGYSVGAEFARPGIVLPAPVSHSPPSADALSVEIFPFAVPSNLKPRVTVCAYAFVPVPGSSPHEQGLICTLARSESLVFLSGGAAGSGTRELWILSVRLK